MPDDRVSGKVTDGVTQTNTLVVGISPAVAAGTLYQSLSHSFAMMAMNAVFAQQQANMAHQAATVQGVALLLSVGKP
jgi:Killing trait